MSVPTWQWRGPGIVLGGGSDYNLITLYPNQTPHLLVTGLPTSNMTRHLGWPLAAQALVGGYVVATIQHTYISQYHLFYHHPNAVNHRAKADTYPRLLLSALAEAYGRRAVLTKYQVEAWQQLPPALLAKRPPLLLLFDQFPGPLQDAPVSLQYRFWRLLDHLLAIQSVGITTVIISPASGPFLAQLATRYQQATCARLAFGWANSADGQAVLADPGTAAMQLEAGQFIFQIGNKQQLGQAANPTQENVGHYLISNNIQPRTKPDWLIPASPPAEPFKALS